MKNSRRPTIRATTLMVDEITYSTAGHGQWLLSSQSTVWRPPTDLYETADRYMVRVEAAGMDENDFIILIEKDVLTITGVRPDVPERRAFHQMEIHYGEFRTEIELPGPIAADKVQAQYQDGFLFVTLPKVLSASY